MKKKFLFIWLLILSHILSAENFCNYTNHCAIKDDSLVVPDRTEPPLLSSACDTNNHVASGDSISHHWKRKKITAAVLAFPLPFGLLGLHRIYLGTKPYVPFVYIGTIGGCLFILPLIDFITILSAKEEDFKRFEKNPGVFMWSH